VCICIGKERQREKETEREKENAQERERASDIERETERNRERDSKRHKRTHKSMFSVYAVIKGDTCNGKKATYACVCRLHFGTLSFVHTYDNLHCSTAAGWMIDELVDQLFHLTFRQVG